MDFGELINLLPLWAVFLLTLAICLGAVEAGFALATYVLGQKKLSEKAPEAPLGSVVSAMLGLLAFILAFTFGMASTRFDARKQLVLEESNSIGTTYLRLRCCRQRKVWKFGDCCANIPISACMSPLKAFPKCKENRMRSTASCGGKRNR